MSFLPTINDGGLVTSVPQKTIVLPHGVETSRRKRTQRTLLEISQNVPSVKNDDSKKLRTRSYDPASGDENDNRQSRKKAKTDRSKSMGRNDPTQNLRKIHEKHFGNIKNKNGAPEELPQKKHLGASGNHHVRFDSESEESFGKKDLREKQHFVAKYSPKHSQGHASRDIPTSTVADNRYSGGQNGGSPISPRRQPPSGTHLARLEAARYRARIWAETYSDPGPNDKFAFDAIQGSKNLTNLKVLPAIGEGYAREDSIDIDDIQVEESEQGSVQYPLPINKVQILDKKSKSVHFDQFVYIRSIDNDKVLRGQQVDPRRGQVPTDQDRNKNAPFMNKGRQDGRPKAAEAGRRLQSLPAKKDTHVSQSEDRPANSAPSKDQGHMNGPMPKINTFVAKSNQASNKSETQTDTQQQSEPVSQTVKTKEPVVIKESMNMQSKPGPQKTETKQSSPEQKPAIKPKIEDKPKVTDTGQKDKPPETNKKADSRTGVAGKTTLEEDHKKNFTASVKPDVHSTSPSKTTSSGKPLPSDDHGPANQPPSKPVEEKQEQQATPANEKFKYYASEKDRKKAEKGSEKADTSSRLHSEKSSKTDKSWVTVKTRTTDGKSSGYPDSPVKSYTTYNMSTSGAQGKMENKRREVTIVDPKYLQQYSDEAREEAFMDEYEYSHNHPHRTKEFNEMNDEEKIEYFRDTLKMKPDQIRELTFHPKVTEPRLIHHAYTGVETVNWLSGSAKLKPRPKTSKKNVYKKNTVVLPSQKKSVMLTRLQGSVYKHINKVYGVSPRDNREKQFFEKLAQLQLDDMQRRYEKLAEKERVALETKFRQRDQLRRLRKKFEDDSWRRFMTQYVTSKVVESEYRDRHEYGLPNDLNESYRRSYNNKSVNRRRQAPLTPRRLQKKNQQKYSTIFNYNAGPVPRTGGKTPKIEGFDTVYIDTEDEQGNPVKKRQNVEALMREAKRILEQSDGDDTDAEATPRKSRATNIRRPERSYNRKPRERKHITDDKSYYSSKTSRSKASSRKPAPKTMKELMDRRHKTPQPVNRYTASSFAAMKLDLLKDSAALNQNKKLNTAKSNTNSKATENKSETKVEPQRERSPVIKEVKTTTTTKEETVETTTNEQNKPAGEVTTYLDNMETQMAIDTKRNKIDEPTPQPSRVSSRVDVKSDSKTPSRTQSRVSYRNTQNSQDMSSQRDIRPPRAPSRTSVLTSESKNIDAVMKSNKPQQRRFSKSSIMPIDENQPSGNTSQNNVNTNSDTKSVTSVNKSVINVKEPIKNGVNGDKVSQTNSKTNMGSRISVKRTNSIASLQQRSSRTTSVDISNMNGRVSPTIERKNESPKRKESVSDKVSIRKMLANNDDKTRPSVANSIYSHDSKKNETTVPKTTVTKNVTTSEQVQEKITEKEIKPQRKPSLGRRDSYRSNIENEDPLTTKKVTRHDKRSQSFNPGDRSRPSDLSSNKDSTTTTKSKKGPFKRRARSRTPQRKSFQENGYGPSEPDIKMDRDQYEQLGHDGKRPHRNRSGTRNGSDRSRKRSVSGGRKKSVSKGRKRSLSRDRKKPTTTNSRFPDIKKKDGEWKILPKSSVQTVSRSEQEDEYVTERVVTPKPANQWQDLVSKYLRQPSPKIGKTEDRSLLDSNMTDDEEDDEMDIFKRAQMRYKLNVDATDDESDDDDDY